MVIDRKIEIQTQKETDFVNITEYALEFIKQNGCVNGQLLVFTPHTTCSIFLQEISHDRKPSGMEYMLWDTLNALRRFVPDTMSNGEQLYAHPGQEHVTAAVGYGEPEFSLLNTDAHLRSSFMGRSQAIPVINGKLILGRFASIYFVDFDETRSRARNVYFQLIGE